jgi:hypothetical protein
MTSRTVLQVHARCRVVVDHGHLAQGTVNRHAMDCFGIQAEKLEKLVGNSSVREVAQVEHHNVVLHP